MATKKKEARSAIVEDTHEARIEAKLDTLIRLLALDAAPEDLPLKERAIRLQLVGMASTDIAALCGTTPDTVRSTLSKANRAGKKQKAKAKK